MVRFRRPGDCCVGTAAAAEKLVTAILDRLGEAATRYPVEEYPKFPGSWLTSIKFEPTGEEDASAAVASLVDRLGGSGWIRRVSEPLLATASWDERLPGAGVLLEPQVTWAHVMGSVPHPDEEPFEPDELVPDEPVVD